MLACLLAAFITPPAMADNATTLPCVSSGATATGPESGTVCWIDWTGLDFNDAGYYSSSGKRIAVAMPGGRMTATLRITGDDASWRAVGYRPGSEKDTYPEWVSLWRGYALPDSITFPAFLHSPRMGVMSVELADVDVTPTGAASNLDDWGMAFADGEMVDGMESVTVETDGTIAELGPALGDGHTTTENAFDPTGGTVTMRGAHGAFYSASVMAASAPTRVKASMAENPGARGSVAFGLRLPHLVRASIGYDANGGTGSMAGGRSAMGETVAVEPNGFTYAGHTFAGWNTKADGTGDPYRPGDVLTVTGDTTLYAQWEANTYKTEFRGWRGRTITSGTAKYGTTPTVPALADTTWLADPDMNFDNVDGWHKTDRYGGSFEFTKDGLITRTRDLYGPSKKPFDGMVHIELQGDASKANGQIGVGWHEIGNSKAYMEWNRCEKGQADCVYDGYSTPSKDNNIETWLQIDSNDDKGYGELLAKHMQLTQVDPTTHNGVARDGYVFTGWDKDVTKPIEGDTVYTAQYRPAVYKVRFDTNGGTGTMANQSHTYDRKQALTASAFTREGYRFTGWNTRGDGKGKAFTDKQTVTNLLAHDGAVGVLYAQWERIPETALPMAGGVIGGIPSIIGGVVTAAALALAVVARRRAGRHAV